ncbi:MAG: DUF1629 domain-containing protein [Pseudomonadota bacterium]
MAEALPKIWYSRILSNSVEISVELDFKLEDHGIQQAADYANDYRRWEPDARRNSPKYLHFDKGRGKIKASAADAMLIAGGMLVISQKFRDVLVPFDLGATRLIEVPIYKADGKTLSDYPPHYLVQISETKPTLVPEESKNIRLPIPPGKTEPLPAAMWGETYEPDELAVRASSAAGADLWADPKLGSRLFFTDRLKRAIKAEKIKSRGLDFVAAKVLPWGVARARILFH